MKWQDIVDAVWAYVENCSKQDMLKIYNFLTGADLKFENIEEDE